MKKRYRVEFDLDVNLVSDNPTFIGRMIATAVENKFVDSEVGTVIVTNREVGEPGDRDFVFESKYHKMFPAKGNKAWYNGRECTITETQLPEDSVRITFPDRTTMKVKKTELEQLVTSIEKLA